MCVCGVFLFFGSCCCETVYCLCFMYKTELFRLEFSFQYFLQCTVCGYVFFKSCFVMKYIVLSIYGDLKVLLARVVWAGIYGPIVSVKHLSNPLSNVGLVNVFLHQHLLIFSSN